MSRIARIAALGIGLATASAVSGAPNVPPPGAESPTVQKGLAYLRGHSTGQQPGEAALAALAMIESGVPASDPGLSAFLGTILARFNGTTTYAPQRTGGRETYEIALVAMVLANLDPKAYREHIQNLADQLIASQNSHGAWDYSNRQSQGDTSMSQYAVLGLWMAGEQGNATIPPQVWDRAARWFLTTQLADGGFYYHPDEPGAGWGGVSISMTAAGTGSLLICRGQLDPHFKPPAPLNPLLIPVDPEGAANKRFVSQLSPSSLESAASKGVSWLGSHYLPARSGVIGPSGYYGLYAVERVGALTRLDRFGGHEWFGEGRRFVEGSQAADGSWDASDGPVVSTSYGVLFLIRANATTIKKIKEKRLGAGTLLGGRGLPTRLDDLTVAGGRVVVRPMNGAVEGMLKVLEDPKAENADAALAGLLAEYGRRGPAVLAPLKDRFRKLLTDKDPGVRRVAAWALARTGELEIVPILINALRDPDPEVMIEVRSGLQLLARKVDGYGPPVGATPEQVLDAIRKWRDWYNTVRPVDQAADQGDDPAAAPAR